MSYSSNLAIFGFSVLATALTCYWS